MAPEHSPAKFKGPQTGELGKGLGKPLAGIKGQEKGDSPRGNKKLPLKEGKNRYTVLRIEV